MERRVFLKSSGLALVAFGAAPSALVRAAAQEGVRRKTLVVVFQRGAMDGLNAVPPYAESAYRSLRPTIALPSPNGGTDAALDLDGHFGLHPALEPLLPLYRDGRLAIVHAVGSPDPTRSHFDAQDFMESGTPGRKATEDGWLNRHLRQQGGEGPVSALRAVSLTPTLPRSLAGGASAVAMTSVERFAVRGGSESAAARGFEDMYAAAADRALSDAARETFEAIDALGGRDREMRAARGATGAPRLTQALSQIARLIKADVGLEIAFAETGGWDHHAGEGGVQGQIANRLRELGPALASFERELGPRMQDVVLVTLTEFGRTVAENGNRGTDHGHGSVSFVLGGNVRGGAVRGRWPGLGRGDLYEGRDLAVTTDFRDLLAEILVRHRGARDLSAVFPGHETSPARFPGVVRA
jgi:uncharacterized protein (DUF1501 family)